MAAEAAAVALLAPVMSEQIDQQGLRPLLEDVELPLASVLARMEARGVRLDVDYLAEMGAGVRERMAELKTTVFAEAGEEFNLNSPPQLRKILYDKLGLQPGKKTPKGELSTDASVLEKLRDAHPVVDALLSWRELDKLNSTYLEALPRLVDPVDGRIHTTFNQAVAATGRLSSSNPNLQNIPVRSELGRQIRRAFVPGDEGQVLLVADYSQIELRILAHLSGDEGLREAFDAGQDIHAATAAKVFDLPPEHVDPESRRRAKAVNYGLAYGMNAWGLAQRLDIAPDEAQEIMDGYFAGFPSIKSYLDAQVGRATVEGFTETLLGPPPLHPGAAGVEPAGAGPRPAPGAERPDPGQRQRRVQGRDDRRGYRVAGPHRAGLPHAPHGPRRAGLRGAPGQRGGRGRAGARADGARGAAGGAAAGRHRLGPQLVRRRARRSLIRARPVDVVSTAQLPSLLVAGLLRRSQIPVPRVGEPRAPEGEPRHE